MQFRHARLLSSDGSVPAQRIEPQQFRIIAHPTGKSVESLLLCSELNK